MSKDFTFSIKSTRFDEDYRPSDNTRITTNVANLARGERREENLRSTLRMIDNRFNAMAHWDNPNGDRYALELDIISVEMDVEAGGIGKGIPLIERSEEHTSELQSRPHLVCRLLLEKKKKVTTS